MVALAQLLPALQLCQPFVDPEVVGAKADQEVVGDDPEVVEAWAGTEVVGVGAAPEVVEAKAGPEVVGVEVS